MECADLTVKNFWGDGNQVMLSLCSSASVRTSDANCNKMLRGQELVNEMPSPSDPYLPILPDGVKKEWDGGGRLATSCSLQSPNHRSMQKQVVFPFNAILLSPIVNKSGLQQIDFQIREARFPGLRSRSTKEFILYLDLRRRTHMLLISVCIGHKSLANKALLNSLDFL